MKPRLVMFARAPEPGAVKTRLQPWLGERETLALYLRLVRHCLQQVRGYGEVELWVAGDPERIPEAWLELVSGLHQQQGADLGERIAHAICARPGGCIVIGSDCPDLDAHYLNRAAAMLRESPVVLGPARDGGFVLLAVQRFERSWLSGVQWGGSSVLQRVRDNLAATGVAAAELETLRDIDLPEDVRALARTGIDLRGDLPC